MAGPKRLPGLPKDYTSRYFLGDVVSRPGEPTFLAKVLRSWADEADDDGVEYDSKHPLDRPLKLGEVGISDLTTGALSIVPESSVILSQRSHLKGDVVKRSLTKVESAMVIDVKTELKLQHVMNGMKISDWVDASLVRSPLAVEARDRVVYDEWIGTVDEVFEMVTVLQADGKCYQLAEMGGLYDIGKRLIEVLPKDDRFAAEARARLPSQAKPETDKIIQIQPLIICVTWNALNQMLPIAEQEKHPEPSRFWQGQAIEKLTRFDGIHTHPVQVNQVVILNNPAPQHWFQSTTHCDGSIEVKELKVLEVRSTLTLRWADGSETTDAAQDIVPYINVDEYESWPAEHVMWRGDGDEKRPAVVQTFDPHQRIANLLFTDNEERMTVSVLEIDTGGPGRDGNYGLDIGLHVLLCENNGSPMPIVPGLGKFDTPEENLITRDSFAGQAEEFTKANSRAIKLQTFLPQGDSTDIAWWGEVVATHLDGTVDVRLPTGETRRLGLQQVQVLNEPGPGMDEMDFPHTHMHMEDLEALGAGGGMGGLSWTQGPMGWLFGSAPAEDARSDASWETMSQDGEGGDVHGQEDQRRPVTWTDIVGPTASLLDQPFRSDDFAMDVDEDEDEQEKRDIEDVEPMISTPAPTQAELPEAGPSSPRAARPVQVNGDADEDPWQRFEVLEEAPMDHHFIGEGGEQGSRSYLSRVNKEHKALKSSLPENILVRTYENRTDLMRCLIIGPEGTPYANAPFVFDIFLDPTKFPNAPPSVHFHSHTNGKGRCNPNLYEDGKVCLSILGTWQGDSSESWNPQKSSLLQVLVSISGLVLVRSPYHCEPAFAKLEGTREGRINSRLYSEKAYVLSRSFVRTALERPPTGLENEIKYLYLRKGVLGLVIDHAKRLIDKAEAGEAAKEDEENEEMWNADAMGSLTVGAILILKRTITALQKIQDDKRAA